MFLEDKITKILLYGGWFLQEIAKTQEKYMVKTRIISTGNKPNRMSNVEIMFILIQFYPGDSDVSSVTPRNMYNFAGYIGHFYGPIGGILSEQILTITIEHSRQRSFNSFIANSLFAIAA